MTCIGIEPQHVDGVHKYFKTCIVDFIDTEERYHEKKKKKKLEAFRERPMRAYQFLQIDRDGKDRLERIR